MKIVITESQYNGLIFILEQWKRSEDNLGYWKILYDQLKKLGAGVKWQIPNDPVKSEFMYWNKYVIWKDTNKNGGYPIQGGNYPVKITSNGGKYAGEDLSKTTIVSSKGGYQHTSLKEYLGLEVYKQDKTSWASSTEGKSIEDLFKANKWDQCFEAMQALYSANSSNEAMQKGALWVIWQLTQRLSNTIVIGWYVCLEVDSNSVGGTKNTGGRFQNGLKSYSISETNKLKTELQNFLGSRLSKGRTVGNTLLLSDFYFNFHNHLLNRWGDTNVFPDGVYNFMNAWFGTNNYNSALNEINNKNTTGMNLVCKNASTVELSSNAISQKPMSASQMAKHILDGISIVSVFLPFVGPFLAAGAQFGKAAILYNQGKKTEAAVEVVFGILPLVGKIPGVSTAGEKLLGGIATKLGSATPLTAEEIKVVNSIIDYDKVISSKVLSTLENKALSLGEKKLASSLVKKAEELGMDYLGVKSLKSQAKEKIVSTINNS